MFYPLSRLENGPNFPTLKEQLGRRRCVRSEGRRRVGRGDVVVRTRFLGVGVGQVDRGGVGDREKTGRTWISYRMEKSKKNEDEREYPMNCIEHKGIVAIATVTAERKTSPSNVGWYSTPGIEDRVGRARSSEENGWRAKY